MYYQVHVLPMMHSSVGYGRGMLIAAAIQQTATATYEFDTLVPGTMNFYYYSNININTIDAAVLLL